MNLAQLRLSAIRGVLWTGGGQMLRQIVAFATSLALARLLSPDDFGVFALTIIAVELAQMFADFGIGSAIVQRQQSDPVRLSTLFWINTGVALVCALLLALSAPFLAEWFRQPVIASVLVMAALNVLVCGAMVTPQALLTMRLQFREIVMAQTLGSLCGSATALSLAFSGAGVWALAAQPIVGSSVTMAIMMRASGWWPTLHFQIASVRDMLGFSGQLLSSSVLGYASRNLWAVILGRALGTHQLGVFNLAQQIVYTPVYQFSAVLVKVLFPTLSRLQDDAEQFKRVCLRAIGTIALLAFPLLTGLFALLEDFVPVVLGPQWQDIVPVLQVLCGVSLVQSVTTTAGTMLMSKGAGRTLLGLSVFSTLTMAPSLLLGQHWGLMGVTYGFAGVNVVGYLLMLHLALKQTGIGWRALLGSVSAALFSALLMAAIVLLLRPQFQHHVASVRLLAGIAIGAMSYIALSLAFNREQIRFLIGALRGAAQR